MKTPATSLTQVLIGKSILETLLVGALAVFAFLSVLPPFFQGWGDVTNTGISGWAVNNASPWQRVEVQLFVDGKFVATGVADQSRPDVLSAGWAQDEWHGYEFQLTAVSKGEHEARVYAVHDSGKGARKTLQLVGEPITFALDGDGKLSSTMSRRSNSSKRSADRK
jgi:hypothetical protein